MNPPRKFWKFNVSNRLKLHLWHPLTLIKGKVIIERNRLTIGVFQCMFAHCLILVNKVIYSFYLKSMKILNGMTFFFQCVTACFSSQMYDNHAKCVILGRSKVCICCHGNNSSIATNFSVSCLFHYICKPDLVFRAFIIPDFFYNNTPLHKIPWYKESLQLKLCSFVSVPNLLKKKNQCCLCFRYWMTYCNQIFVDASHGNTLMVLLERNFVLVFLEFMKGCVVFNSL